jgi:hypothetical protein
MEGKLRVELRTGAKMTEDRGRTTEPLPNPALGASRGSLPSRANRMNGTRSYHWQLRAIGQVLEARNINVFNLKRHGDQYIVHGQPEKDRSLLGKLREWRDRWSGRTHPPSLRFPLTEIERLDRAGKAKRSRANKLPDFYSLSSTLRTVGYYLDAAEAELLELRKDSLDVTLLYENRQGHPRVEERSIASFYNLFCDLYGKRGKTGA